MAALRALSLRCSFVILSARTLPPLSPPLRPSMTASGSFPVPSVASMTAWRAAYAVWLASSSSTLLGRLAAALGFFFTACLPDRFGTAHDRISTTRRASLSRCETETLPNWRIPNPESRKLSERLFRGLGFGVGGSAFRRQNDPDIRVAMPRRAVVVAQHVVDAKPGSLESPRHLRDRERAKRE